MSVVLVVGAMWVAFALGLALLLAGAIRVADGEQTTARTGRNVAVDGDPLLAPVFETAGRPSALPAPRAARLRDQG